MRRRGCVAAILLVLTQACGSASSLPSPAPTASSKTGPAATEVPLWPAGLAIARPEVSGPETVVHGDRLIGGRTITAIQNVTRPTMTIYPVQGRNSHAALMVYPGGGYQALAMDLEGSDVCDWATARGITCVVVKYRVPQTWNHYDADGHWLYQHQPKPFLPLQDAQRAMVLLRQRAGAWGVDPHKIGVVGFSAGGHLVTAISNAAALTYTPVDAADRLGARPDFAMPIYPGHLWSAKASGSPDRAALYAFDPVRADAPPTFIVQAEDDPIDDVRNAVAYFLALRAKKVPVEMHIYAHGGHAFGLRPTDQPITRWPALAQTWMRTIGMLDGPPPTR